MGIHIAKTMLDEMTYEPGPPNLWRLCKRLPGGPCLFPAYAVQPFDSDSTTLTVRGSLDINSAPQLGERSTSWSRQARSSRRLSGLDLIDSSGVAALVKLYKGVRSAGGNVTISGVRDQPLAIFKLLRMDKVFNL